jgi:hypothetical protein
MEEEEEEEAGGEQERQKERNRESAPVLQTGDLLMHDDLHAQTSKTVNEITIAAPKQQQVVVTRSGEEQIIIHDSDSDDQTPLAHSLFHTDKHTHTHTHTHTLAHTADGSCESARKRKWSASFIDDVGGSRSGGGGDAAATDGLAVPRSVKLIEHARGCGGVAAAAQHFRESGAVAVAAGPEEEYACMQHRTLRALQAQQDGGMHAQVC